MYNSGWWNVKRVFYFDKESGLAEEVQNFLSTMILEHPEGLSLEQVDSHFRGQYPYHPDLDYDMPFIDYILSHEHIFRSALQDDGHERYFAAFDPKGEVERSLEPRMSDQTPKEVKHRLKSLFIKYGYPVIPQKKLQEVYSRHFNELIDYEKYGYYSLDSFICAHMGFIFSQRIKNERLVLTFGRPTYSICDLEQMDPAIFQPECIAPFEPMRYLDISVLPPAQYMLIDIKNPEDDTMYTGFAFRFANYAGEYKKMTKRMTQFYEEHIEGYYSYKLPVWAAIPNVYCAVFWNKCWRRLQIVSDAGHKVQCLLVDEAEYRVFKKRDLYYLYKDFAKLPCQVLGGQMCYLDEGNSAEIEDSVRHTIFDSSVRVRTFNDIEEHVKLAMEVEDSVVHLNTLVKKRKNAPMSEIRKVQGIYGAKINLLEHGKPVRNFEDLLYESVAGIAYRMHWNRYLRD